MAIARRFLPPWSVEERAGLLGCRALLRRETEPRAALQRRGYHTYFAARAIIATVTITNAAICSQKLLVMSPLFASWVSMVDHLPLKTSDATKEKN
jgi:hypothetical protein